MAAHSVTGHDRACAEGCRRCLPGPHPRPPIAEQSKNYRHSANHQVVIDADTRVAVAVDRPVAGNRNDRRAWEMSGAQAALGKTIVIPDRGYRGTGLVIPHRRAEGQAELPAWKQEHSASHRKARARVEQGLRPDEGWNVLRDGRLKSHGVHHAMLGIARMRNLALAR